MKWPRPRMTIGRLMVAVAVVALISAIVLAVPPTIDPLLRERGIRLGVGGYTLVVVLLTSAVAVPSIAAIVVSCDVVARARKTGRLPFRRLVAAIALFVAASAIVLRPLPLDGLRQAHRLNRDTFVSFYHQYRLWPGRHVTPCLEIDSEGGGRQTYPINASKSIIVVDPRTNADRTVVWFLEVVYPAVRPRKVVCSLDLVTGEFISTPGPFPVGVDDQSGFPF